MGFTKEYYPQIASDFADASVGSWMVDMLADVADNLSYHIDRVYQETNINSAQKKSSLQALARNNGIKLPGPKGAIVELKFTCELPLYDSYTPNYKYAPIIKKGTKVSSGSQVFETISDIDFSKQFNNDGISDRTIAPIRNSNGVVTKYEIAKYVLAVASQTKIYSKYISASEITPFMEITLPDSGVMSVDGILTKAGTFNVNPQINEFYKEGVDDRWFQNGVETWRFHEVDFLAQQERWGDVINDGEPETEVFMADLFDENRNPIGQAEVSHCIKGEWKPLKQKFITEFTDKGYLKIIFGSGNSNDVPANSGEISPNSALISKIINNDSLGVLPKAGHTMFILYRTGGGKTTNLAANSIKTISELNAHIPITDGQDANEFAKVKNSIKVTNPAPSVSGKDSLTEDEMRYLVKYSKPAQDRCVTLKDYVSRVLLMPSRYGTPFRVSAAEDNNKILLYVLGIDHEGKLSALLPETLATNIKNYLENYKCINDFVEIRSGKIVNVSFEVDVYVDKNFETPSVISNIINCIKDYMDVNNIMMGEDIFVGDIQKEISKIDGVINLIELRVYNETGEGYSSTATTQPIKKYSDDGGCGSSLEDRDGRIDLIASDGILYSEGDTMLEIKYPDKDIRVRVKLR